MRSKPYVQNTPLFIPGEKGLYSLPHGRGWSGYEGNSGIHVVQAHTTNSLEIQHIGVSELGRFGSCCTAFSHRKGIEPPGPTLMDFKFPITPLTRG